MRPASLRHVFVLLILTAAAVVIYARTQPETRLLDGKGHDGSEYSRIYQRLENAATVPAAFPFCQRIAVPWLAAHLPVNEPRAFLIVNVVAGVVAILFCFLALLERVSPGVAWFSIALMLGGIFSPIRYSFFEPFTADPLVMACYAVAAWLFARRLTLSAIVVLAASSMVKESGVYFALLFSAYAVVGAPAGTRRRTAMLLGGVCVAAAVMNRMVAAEFCASHSTIWLVLTNGYLHLRSPWGLVALVAGVSLTAGPFLFGWCYSRAEATSIVSWRSPFFAAGMLALVMALFGGSDMTRIFFVAYPLYVLYLAEHVRAISPVERMFLLAAGLTANHVFERLPESVVPAADPNLKSFFNFVPDHSPYSVALTILAFWAIVYLAIERLTRSRQ